MKLDTRCFRTVAYYYQAVEAGVISCSNIIFLLRLIPIVHFKAFHALSLTLTLGLTLSVLTLSRVCLYLTEAFTPKPVYDPFCDIEGIQCAHYLTYSFAFFLNCYVIYAQFFMSSFSIFGLFCSFFFSIMALLFFLHFIYSFLFESKFGEDIYFLLFFLFQLIYIAKFGLLLF